MITSKNIWLSVLFFVTVSMAFLRWYDRDLYYRLDWLFMMSLITMGVMSKVISYFKQRPYEKHFIFTGISICFTLLCGWLLGDSLWITWQYFYYYELQVTTIEKYFIDTTSDTSFSFQLLVIGATILSLFFMIAPQIKR